MGPALTGRKLHPLTRTSTRRLVLLRHKRVTVMVVMMIVMMVMMVMSSLHEERQCLSFPPSV